ncbi:unnamed protein product [Rotaria sp. Silwood1]|nr:unnamed protein product [Rotaria sp. Silwood1]CAF3438578.1 unnamed protein product [Rotaria sp. Silwood1]CAF4687361.1 unnamed protein product [Rotaria sp. Silwood1]
MTEWSNIRSNTQFWDDFARCHFLPFAKRSRWFAGKTRSPYGASVRHILEWSVHTCQLLIVDVYYEDESESYFLPLGFLPSKPDDLSENACITEITRSNGDHVLLIDAVYDESFRRALFNHFIIGTNDKSLSITRFKDFDDFYQSSDILSTDSTNSLMVFNDKYLFKLYRKLTTGQNLEVEMLTFIGKSEDFSNHIPTCLGSIDWSDQQDSTMVLVLVQKFIPKAYDCWSMIIVFNEYQPRTTKALDQDNREQ